MRRFGQDHIAREFSSKPRPGTRGVFGNWKLSISSSLCLAAVCALRRSTLASVKEIAEMRAALEKFVALRKTPRRNLRRLICARIEACAD
jgi:hypothetical protein